MCEMKFYSEEFSVNKDYHETLVKRQSLLSTMIPKKSVVHGTLITTYGLTYNEYSDRALEIMKLISKRDKLGPVIGNNPSGVTVFIGKENSLSQLSGSSLLVARFSIGENDCGTIGLIGPVRMDYAKLIPHLEYFAEKLGTLLSITYQRKTGDENG